jgi:hypothetical protein
MECKRSVKVYDEHGIQLTPDTQDDPMFSDLYCREKITDCDRILTIQFYEYRNRDDFINVYTGIQVKPITIRIDAAYDTIESIHNVLTEYFKYTPDGNSPYKEYPELEDLEYYYTKKDHPIIKLKHYEWLDNYPYNDILVKEKYG